MNGPGVPRKLTFALRVRVSRNHSAGGSGAGGSLFTQSHADHVISL